MGFLYKRKPPYHGQGNPIIPGPVNVTTNIATKLWTAVQAIINGSYVVNTATRTWIANQASVIGGVIANVATRDWTAIQALPYTKYVANVASRTWTALQVSADTAGTSFAWNSSGVRAESVYNDWPGRDYANISTFLSSTAKYPSHYAGFGVRSDSSQAFAFDNTNQIDGYQSLTQTVKASLPAMGSSQDTYLGPIPNALTRLDQTVHVRCAFKASPYPDDLVQPFVSHLVPGATSGTGTRNYAMLVLAFDPTPYGYAGYDYGYTNAVNGSNGGWRGAIVLSLDYYNGKRGYNLWAGLRNAGGTVISTETITQLCNIGDEMWDEGIYDFFLRTYRSGVNNSTLNIEVYYGKKGFEPIKIGTTAISLLNTSTAFPQPYYLKYATMQTMSTWGQDATHRWGFFQVFDNTTNPNIALNYGSAVDAAGNGWGVHGKSLSRRLMPIQSIASTAALNADNQKRYELSDTTYDSLEAADVAHSNKKFFRMNQPNNSFRASTGFHDTYFHRIPSEISYKEIVQFSAGWSVYGAGDPDTGTAQGPGYKWLQVSMGYGSSGINGNSRLELVGKDLQIYSEGGSGVNYIDTALQGFVKTGPQSAGGQGNFTYVAGTNTPGTLLDFITTPVGNIQGETDRPGTRFGQLKEIELSGHVMTWYDADIQRWKFRHEQYIGLPGATPIHWHFIEWTALNTITQLLILAVDFGENFNERVMTTQTFDRHDMEVVDAADPAFGSDPYGKIAALGLLKPNAPTVGSATSPTTTSLTYNVAAPATGGIPIYYIIETLSGGIWTPRSAVAWVGGLSANTNVVVTGLTTGTNYTGKIRFSFLSNFGKGTTTLVSNGTTT